MAACLAAVEAEEVLLQVYALEWRAIELRSKQLQNQFKQIELDEELDREERELLREHEQMLRMKEKQLVQQQYEERFRLRVAEATARKLQQQSDKQQQAATEASAAVSVATTTSKTTTAIKRKSKAKNVAGDEAEEEKKGKKSTAVSKSNGDGDIVKRKKKDTTKRVAFSPRKPAVSESSHASRRLEESFNEENEPDVMNTNVAKKSAADELMMMLSQDKMSDSEGDEPSLANLISFSPAVNSTEPRYLRYGSPSRSKTNEASNDTPSKFTPSKLARSVVKKAMAIPLDFDFTRRAELAKAKAAKEKQQATEEDEDDDEAGVEADTPVSKKALKRRKDLGISLSDRSPAPSKPAAKATSAESKAAKNPSSRGGKSLMEMVTAASLVESKLSKTKEASAQPKTNAAVASEKNKHSLHDKNQAKEPFKPKSKDKPAKEKKSDAAEPESEDFIGIQTTNITKRSKPKQSAKPPQDAIAELEAEVAVTSKKADKPKEKPKKKDKLSAVEQAIAKTGMLTRMSKMQDISTPKVVGKKTKKSSKKATSTTLAAKRAEFQKILADGTSEAAADLPTTDGDDIEEESGAFETPRKARTMKRKRAQDLPGQGDAAAPGKKAALGPAQQPQTNYLQSPSVAALLAMRPSKSPIGIRYVPKTPKTPQSLRKRQRTTDDDAQNSGAAAFSTTDNAMQGANAGLVTRAKKQAVRAARSAFAGTTGALTSTAGSLWGNSGPSFFDAFVNGGAPRLKRSALP